MTVDDIIARCGGPIEVSYQLKLSQFAIREWRYNGIPKRHWKFIALKADVTIEEIWEASSRVAEATRNRRAKPRQTSS